MRFGLARLSAAACRTVYDASWDEGSAQAVLDHTARPQQAKSATVPNMALARSLHVCIAHLLNVTAGESACRLGLVLVVCWQVPRARTETKYREVGREIGLQAAVTHACGRRGRKGEVWRPFWLGLVNLKSEDKWSWRSLPFLSLARVLSRLARVCQ